MPGQSPHEELALLVGDANLSPLDALRAASRGAAIFLGRSRIGDSVGGTADLILLDADPLADISQVSRVRQDRAARLSLFDRCALTGPVDAVSAAPDVAPTIGRGYSRASRVLGT